MLRLFRAFADALPPDAASLTIVEEPGPGVAFSFGKGSIYEVPTKGRRYTDSPFLEEVRLLCSAVIQGSFAETIWLKGDEVVETRGEVRVNDRAIPHFWRQVFTNPFRRARKETIAYTPFVTQQPS